MGRGGERAPSEAVSDAGAAGLGYGIGHLLVRRRIRRVERAFSLGTNEKATIVTAGTTGPAVGWLFLLVMAGVLGPWGLGFVVPAPSEPGPLATAFFIMWGPMVASFLIASMLWKPVGVVLTNQRILVGRTAPITHRSRCLLLDASLDAVSVRSSLVLNSLTLTTLVLDVNDHDAPRCLRLVFYGPVLQRGGTDLIQALPSSPRGAGAVGRRGEVSVGDGPAPGCEGAEKARGRESWPESIGNPYQWSRTAVLLTGIGVAAVVGFLLVSTRDNGSSKGSMIFAKEVDGNWDIYQRANETSVELRLTSHPAEEKLPSLRYVPRSRVVFVSNRDGNMEIYMMERDGSKERRLTRHLGEDTSPDWSPDGSRIVFVSDRAGNLDLYTVMADGTGLRRLTDHPAQDYTPAWASNGRVSDGTDIAFASGRNNNYDIYVMRADGSNNRRLTTDPAIDYAPAWSPDGRRIAFVRETNEGRQLYLVYADGTGETRLTKEPIESSGLWSSDGKQIKYQRTLDGRLRTFAINPEGTSEVLVG